jgi:hypothetical protein
LLVEAPNLVQDVDRLAEASARGLTSVFSVDDSSAAKAGERPPDGPGRHAEVGGDPPC